MVLLFSICKELAEMVMYLQVGLLRLLRLGRASIDGRPRMDVWPAARDLTLVTAIVCLRFVLCG